MKCNIDLRQSLGVGGINNYIRNISSLLVDNNWIQFAGCSFWYRNINPRQYSWFKGKFHKTFYPSKFAFSPYLRLPIAYETLMHSPADLNIFFSYKLPYVRFSSPVVSTVHDIILLKTNCESAKVIREHRRILEDTVQRSKYILTVSESSKKDLMEEFGIDTDRIFIVHNGINQSAFSKRLTSKERNIIKRKYGLPDKFILNFGVYRKHKNIERLIEAYASLPVGIRNNLKLVLTRTHPVLENIIDRLGIRNDVTIIGFVPDEDKSAIYQMADIFYYASLYEGFGVPVIEAQAAGIPVITSTTSSLPEAAGGAALLVDPYETHEIAEAIKEVYFDKDKADILVERGLANSKQYTWQRSINEFSLFLKKIDTDGGK